MYRPESMSIEEKADSMVQNHMHLNLWTFHWAGEGLSVSGTGRELKTPNNKSLWWHARGPTAELPAYLLRNSAA